MALEDRLPAKAIATGAALTGVFLGVVNADYALSEHALTVGLTTGAVAVYTMNSEPIIDALAVGSLFASACTLAYPVGTLISYLASRL